MSKPVLPEPTELCPAPIEVADYLQRVLHIHLHRSLQPSDPSSEHRTYRDIQTLRTKLAELTAELNDILCTFSDCRPHQSVGLIRKELHLDL